MFGLCQLKNSSTCMVYLEYVAFVLLLALLYSCLHESFLVFLSLCHLTHIFVCIYLFNAFRCVCIFDAKMRLLTSSIYFSTRYSFPICIILYSPGSKDEGFAASRLPVKFTKNALWPDAEKPTSS